MFNSIEPNRNPGLYLSAKLANVANNIAVAKAHTKNKTNIKYKLNVIQRTTIENDK